MHEGFFYIYKKTKRIYDNAALKHWKKACSKTEKTSQEHLCGLLAGMGIHNVDPPTHVSKGFALAIVRSATDNQPERTSVPFTDRFNLRHIKLYNKTMTMTIKTPAALLGPNLLTRTTWVTRVT